MENFSNKSYLDKKHSNYFFNYVPDIHDAKSLRMSDSCSLNLSSNKTTDNIKTTSSFEKTNHFFLGDKVF
jgi:hypothetical protein